jgi:5-methylcytosine-specific restriction endonuclease McrA
MFSIPQKYCPQCRTAKSPDSFSKSSCHKDGWYPICRDCRSKRRRERYRELHPLQPHDPAKIEARKQRRAAYNKQWQKTRRMYVREKYRAYRRANKERYKELKRKWYKAHPEYEVMRSHERRARVKSAPGTYTQAEWRALCSYYGDRCLRCGTTESLTVDHIVPLVHGGSNDISNLQPLCISCNSWKCAKTVDFRPSPCPFVQLGLFDDL